MKSLVEMSLPQSDIENIAKQLDGMTGMVKAFSTSLNDTQRVGLRTMAEGREGLVRTISRIANTHVSSLPRNEDPTQLENALAYYDQLANVLQKTGLLHEMIDDTVTALGADIMAISDRYSNFLQTARLGDNSLDMAMNQLDAYNQRFGARSAVKETSEDTPVP